MLEGQPGGGLLENDGGGVALVTLFRGVEIEGGEMMRCPPPRVLETRATRARALAREGGTDCPTVLVTG